MQAILPYVPAALAMAILTPALFSIPLHLSDYTIFWYAGRIILEGGSPYDNAQWLAAAPDLPAVARMVPLYPTRIWAYPPWVAHLFVPQALLPLEAGVVLQRVLYLLVGVAASLLIVRAIPWRTAFAPALALTLTAAFQPFVNSVRGGEHGPLMLAGVALAMWGLRRGASDTGRGRHAVTSGAAIGAGLLLALVKPHLAYAFALVVALLVVERRRWWTAAAAAAVFGGVGLASLLLYPDALGAMVGGGGDRLALAETNATTWSLASLFVPGMWAGLGAGFVIGAALLCLYALRAAAPELRLWSLAAASLLLSAATSPYANNYDHYLLLPAVYVTLATADRSARRERLVQLALLALVAAIFGWVGFFVGVARESYSALGALPLVLAGLFALGAMTARAEVRQRSGSSASSSSITGMSSRTG